MGTTYDNITIGDGGEQEILRLYDGDTANRTAVNRYGELIIDGGTANSTTLNDGGAMTISDGGIANSTICSSGFVSMYISNGGTANDTVLSGGGTVYISSGGTASNTTISGQSDIEQLHVFIDEGAVLYQTTLSHTKTTIENDAGSTPAYMKDTVLSGDSMFLVQGAAYFENLTVHDNGQNYYAFQCSGSETVTFRGTITVAGGILTSSNIDAQGAEVIFAINECTPDSSYLLSDTEDWSGATFYITAVDSSACGTYKLADRCSYDEAVLFKSENGQIQAVLSYAGTQTIGGLDYTIEKNTHLLLSITESTEPVSGDSVFIIRDGHIEAHGQTLTDRTVGRDHDERMLVLQSGLARQTEVYSQGTMEVMSGGEVRQTTVSSGGIQFLSSGASADDTQLYDGGKMFVSGEHRQQIPASASAGRCSYPAEQMRIRSVSAAGAA